MHIYKIIKYCYICVLVAICHKKIPRWSRRSLPSDIYALHNLFPLDMSKTYEYDGKELLWLLYDIIDLKKGNYPRWVTNDKVSPWKKLW